MPVHVFCIALQAVLHVLQDALANALLRNWLLAVASKTQCKQANQSWGSQRAWPAIHWEVDGDNARYGQVVDLWPE